MLTKSQLKKIFTENDIKPKKSLGQSFLIDKNIKDKIIEKAGIKKTDFVLEIGSGTGALTEDLAKMAGRVVAIEKDKALVKILKGILSPYKNATIVEADILKFNLGKAGSKNIKVIGNLPYYITSPIIIQLLRFRKYIDSILITVQKEVAQRIVAKPASKNYGSLTLYILFYAKPTIEMSIKAAAFFPRPDVDSSLVRLEIRDEPAVSIKNEETLFKIIRAAFGQRRKTLPNALKTNFLSIRSMLESAGINPARRGETLSLEEFAQIANTIDNPA